MVVIGHPPAPLGAQDIPGQPSDADTGAKPGSYIAAGDSYTPHPYLPTRGHLTYLRELFTVALMVLALPILFFMLLKSPRGFAARIATVAAT